MTHETTHSDVYDPEHPWIRDARDDPGAANWFAEFLDTAGVTRQPVFLRGQMYLALIRTVILVVAMSMIGGGQPILAAGVAFIGLSLLLSMSLVSHLRRLNDAGRSGLLAVLVAIPLILASVSGMMSVGAIPDRMDQIEAAMEAPVATEGEAGAEAEAAPPPQAGRGGPPKPVTEMSMLGEAVSQSINMWFLLSLFGMCFSFFYVARGKTVDRNSINGF